MAEPKSPISATRWWALALLTIIASLGAIDRQLPFILAEPIKRELGLSDGQLGLIGGAAFALFYTALVLPVASLADRTSRKWVLVGAVTVWSAMTAAGSVATTFFQMAMARVGVAAGESGCNAPSHSMIADLFAPDHRATALAVYALGPTVGIMAGFALGGMLADIVGWRGVFVVFGVSGLALALVAAVFLPPLQGVHGATGRRSMRAALQSILAQPGFIALIAAASTLTFVAQGVMAWLSPLTMRIFGLSATQAGLMIGLPIGLAGSAGVLLGGMLADRLGSKRPRLRLAAPAMALIASVPLLLAALLSTSASGFLVAASIGMMLSAMPLAPTLAMVQNLADPAQRATTAAVVILFTNLVGGGLGPPAAGFLSDALAPAFGLDALRFALCGVLLAYVVAGALYFVAARLIQPSMRRAV